MRRWRAIAFATALETLSEPAVYLIALASLALASVAPALHYHQFGDPTRMARDSGLSALLLGGCTAAVFAAVRTFRREIETGTAEAALAHPVSRCAFLLSKCIGCALAIAIVQATVFATSLTMTRGAGIGAEVAAAKGELATVWGPSYAIAVATMTVPALAAAALNRFGGFRFVFSANLMAFAIAFCGAFYRVDLETLRRFVPAAVLGAEPAFIALAMAAAFAARFRANAAFALSGLSAAALVPALGNYCPQGLETASAAEAALYVLAASAAAVVTAAAFLAVGCCLVAERRG